MTIKQVPRVLAGQLDTSTQFNQRQSKSVVVDLKEPVASVVTKELHVDLSAAARMGSQLETRQSNDDIDQSDLPAVVKALLKQLRDLRQKIIEKLTELQKLMHDQKMHPELRKQRLQMLQTEIMALEATYVGVSQQLEKLSRGDTLSAEQKVSMAQLMLS